MADRQPRVVTDMAPPLAGVTLEYLVDEFSPSIFRVAVSIVRDRALAEDVVQETLIKAWQGLPGFRGESPLRGWVLRIAHNTAISMLRKRRDDVRDPFTMPERDGEISLEREVAGKAMLDELWVILDRLDETSRTMIVLRELEGMSYEDISAAMRLPLPTVKTRLFRARKTLANALEGWNV